MNGDSIMQHCVRDLADFARTLSVTFVNLFARFIVFDAPGIWQIPARALQPWLADSCMVAATCDLADSCTGVVSSLPEIWQIPAQAPWRRDLADSCSFAVRLEIWQIPAQPLSARSGRFLRAVRRPGIWLIPAQAKVDTFISHL